MPGIQALLLPTQGRIRDLKHSKGRLVSIQTACPDGRRGPAIRPLSLQPPEDEQQKGKEGHYLKPKYGHRHGPQQGTLSV